MTSMREGSQWMSWKDEMQSSYLYEVMARVESDSKRRKMFESLGSAARAQAQIWKDNIKKNGNTEYEFVFRPSFRARVVKVLLEWLGPRPLKPLLAAMKVRGISVYAEDFPSYASQSIHDVVESHAVNSNKFQGANLRAVVFGLSDGLVSNASLVLGVYGAGVDDSVILITGVAGLLAGAFSMASGEYISVKSQRELFEYQMALEAEELKLYPEEEASELALIYEAKGIEKELAKNLGQQLIRNPDKALTTLAREELGLNPDDLGSPVKAAVSSFASFALGAIIPVAPFIIGQWHQSIKVQVSTALSVATAFGVGAILSLFSGRSAMWGGLRLVIIGGAAGVCTYFIGRLFGV
jgi:VIT1/CCC1 family predicted Fe2+/Mn2+ transporter